jgi:hypothetical protein
MVEKFFKETAFDGNAWSASCSDRLTLEERAPGSRRK